MAKTIIKVIKNVKITFPLVAFAISAMAKQNAKIAGRSINKKRYNEELTDKEKLILAMILYLSEETSSCFASNKYIANIVKCRPPNNRDPEPDEVLSCINYLRNQVMIVKPKIIVLLGRISLQNILGKEYGITASRGKWVEKKGIMYMPTWHPAALLRDETKKVDFINDLNLVKNKIN